MENVVILDTDVLINVLRGLEPGITLLDRLEGRHRLATTSVSAFELFHGAWRTRNPAGSLRAADALLDRLDVFGFSLEASREAGRILASLQSEGRVIGFRDVFIAATAMVNSCLLASLNFSHFERIEGLRLIGPQHSFS